MLAATAFAQAHYCVVWVVLVRTIAAIVVKGSLAAQ